MSNIFTTVSTDLVNIKGGDEIYLALFLLNKNIDENGNILSLKTPDSKALSQEELNEIIQIAIERKIILEENNKLRVSPKYWMLGFKEKNSGIFSLRTLESMGGSYECF